MRPAITIGTLLAVTLSLLVTAAPASATAPAPTGFTCGDLVEVAEPDPETAPAMGSPLAYPSLLVSDELLAQRGMTRTPKQPKPKSDGTPDSAAPAEPPMKGRGMGTVAAKLSGERVRVMLQSLTVPGWGQATIGRPRAGLAFALVEVGVWASFAGFRIQEQMRRDTYVRTAQLMAGIDLAQRDEEYRRLVGLYSSSEEYNRLVVRRDAANLYYGDPAAYNAYVAAHELKGNDVWAWGTEDDLERYRDERQAAQRATKHAQDALAVALINRLLSVIHVSRAEAPRAPDRTSWSLEYVPVADDPTAFRLGLRADF